MGRKIKRFICRNPFIAKTDKYLAYEYLHIAENNLSIAETYCKNADGTYTDQGCALIMQATKMWNLAANSLGFRNIKDMEEYKERKGHL